MKRQNGRRHAVRLAGRHLRIERQENDFCQQIVGGSCFLAKSIRGRRDNTQALTLRGVEAGPQQMLQQLGRLFHEHGKHPVRVGNDGRAGTNEGFFETFCQGFPFGDVLLRTPRIVTF